MHIETWSRAQNMQVVTLAEGAIVARLEDFQFDLDSHEIYGWRLKVPGMFARYGRVRSDHLTLIGQDVAFVTTVEDVHWSKEKPKPSQGRAWASGYLGVGAVTRRGKTLGAVEDYVLDRKANRITGLVLQGGLLLPLVPEVRTGSAAIIVPREELLVELPGEPDGAEEVGFWRRLLESVGGGRKEVATSQLPKDAQPGQPLVDGASAAPLRGGGEE